MRAALRRAGIAASATLLALVLCETGLRAKAWYDDRGILTEALRDVPPVAPGSHVSLRQIVQLSADDHIIYELKPGISAVFDGQPLETNAAGFRGPAVAVAKEPGVVRILGLGDSVMFGWGVSEGEDYLAQLANRLRESFPDREWEAINTAVPGYNTVQEVRTLTTKGLAYEPDIVVLGLVSNDLALPSFLRPKQPYFDLRASFLLRLLGDRVATSENADPLVLAPGTSNEAGLVRFESNPEEVDPQYRHLLGWDAFDAALEELARLSEQHGFSVVVTYLSPRSSEAMDRALQSCAETGFHVVNLAEVLRTYMKANGIRRYLGSVLTISATDRHPSVLTHGMVARELADELASSGILDRHR